MRTTANSGVPRVLGEWWVRGQRRDWWCLIMVDEAEEDGFRMVDGTFRNGTV